MILQGYFLILNRSINEKKFVIDEKINRYKNEIITAKELSKLKHADRIYYENLVSKFEKIIKFYEDLKVWRKYSEI